MEKMKEITMEELSVMPKESFVLIDIRDERIASYGMIPGAVNIPADKLESEHNRLCLMQRRQRIMSVRPVLMTSISTRKDTVFWQRRFTGP